MKPLDIERKSFEIITRELNGRVLPKEQEAVIKRVIHTTADFDYADTLTFSPRAVTNGIEALKSGCHIVTDTQMVKAGINKGFVERLGGQVHCFMSDEDVAAIAKERETTRAAVSMEKALTITQPCIFAIGNAPTALLALEQLIKEQRLKPSLIIGVPVGFVNVVEAKEQLMDTACPYIITRGRKGGSNVAAAIVNALLYQIFTRD